MTQKERMLKEMLYYPADTVLAGERAKAKELCFDFNQCRPSHGETRVAILKELLGKTGENVWMEQPIYFDYGCNTEVGENFFANANCVILDVAKVTIGKNVMFAPNVSLYTAGHPLHPETRNSGWEYGIGISIGDNVWVGGNVVINPGVHIGNNVVIGSGSVVTKDIPDNCVAVGNPARVIKEITDEDKKYYFKDRLFETGGEITDGSQTP